MFMFTMSSSEGWPVVVTVNGQILVSADPQEAGRLVAGRSWRMVPLATISVAEWLRPLRIGVHDLQMPGDTDD